MPHIDFLAYTFKGLNIRGSKSLICSCLKDMIDDLLPFPVVDYIITNNCEFEVAAIAGMGYNFRLFFPNLGISVLTDGATDGHGTHVVLSGSIFKLVGMKRSDFVDFNDSISSRIINLVDIFNDFCDFEYFLYHSDIDFNISRCDIAYDFNVNFDEFYNRLENGLFKYPAKKISKIIDENNHGTIYIGSRSCVSFIRIYDKALEIKERNKTMLGLFSSEVPENYTRVEFEFKNSSRNKNASLAFNFYLQSDEDIGNYCYKFLKINDEIDGNVVEWDVYKNVILYNCVDFQVEYNDIQQHSINLTYLQIVANLIVTYCRRMPGLLNWLSNNLSVSKSALRKTSNVNIDFSQLYDSCCKLVNENEVVILEHLTFFDSDKLDNADID